MPKKPELALDVDGHLIGLRYPTYFIADIAANHDGDLEKAKQLITLAKKAGADAAKFQHFRANKIVSKHGFESIGKQLSHQSKWKKSVYQVYQDASVPWSWTEELKRHSDRIGIHFFSAPYDIEAIDMLDPYVPAYKVGSGDMTWHESLKHIASKQKPIFLATGASTTVEVEAAVQIITKINPRLCLMQCNTNYTGSKENFKHINLNVLKTYLQKFPAVILGLSDHTPGHATVLGAVTLGARAVEKHFTDNRKNVGPDHGFSMEPSDWQEMVERTRELEMALGVEIKKVETNEEETILVQRRCCRAARAIQSGEILKREDIDVLRPVKPGAYTASEIDQVVGKKAKCFIPQGEALMKHFLTAPFMASTPIQKDEQVPRSSVLKEVH